MEIANNIYKTSCIPAKTFQGKRIVNIIDNKFPPTIIQFYNYLKSNYLFFMMQRLVFYVWCHKTPIESILPLLRSSTYPMKIVTGKSF